MTVTKKQLLIVASVDVCFLNCLLDCMFVSAVIAVAVTNNNKEV